MNCEQLIVLVSIVSCMVLRDSFCLFILILIFFFFFSLRFLEIESLSTNTVKASAVKL